MAPNLFTRDALQDPMEPISREIGTGTPLNVSERKTIRMHHVNIVIWLPRAYQWCGRFEKEEPAWKKETESMFWDLF